MHKVRPLCEQRVSFQLTYGAVAGRRLILSAYHTARYHGIRLLLSSSQTRLMETASLLGTSLGHSLLLQASERKIA
ncbi:hypothetical protein AMECASPLE_017355 [Ameca splendens]|uniref:Uncharacterized protein n=1 Tax=Ameca splendens TaxID=208324 RepID=A0ABV0YEJ1_9TELE